MTTPAHSRSVTGDLDAGHGPAVSVVVTTILAHRADLYNLSSITWRESQ